MSPPDGDVYFCKDTLPGNGIQWDVSFHISDDQIGDMSMLNEVQRQRYRQKMQWRERFGPYIFRMNDPEHVDYENFKGVSIELEHYRRFIEYLFDSADSSDQFTDFDWKLHYELYIQEIVFELEKLRQNGIEDVSCLLGFLYDETSYGPLEHESYRRRVDQFLGHHRQGNIWLFR